MISETTILNKLTRQPKQSASYKTLVRELGVRGDARRQFSTLLADMVQRGKLLQLDGDSYTLPDAAARKNLVVGRLSMHRDGYGFVIPESGNVKERLSGDIFINPQAVGNAMHGDTVLVEMGPVRSDGRAEGHILRVMGRAHATVVGTFHYGGRYNYVTPIDEKITQEIVIPRGAEMPRGSDAGAAEGAEVRRGKRSRDRVIGKEAKVTTDWEDLEGLVVDVEITDFPTPTQNPRGRVVEVLGHEDDFGVDVEIVIRKYHLPHRFPVAALEEAQAVEPIMPARELRRRRDFRNLPIVTIDGETARDFDDAVFVRRLSNGNFELQVHIADVAHYVGEGSALDAEARLRGNSVYFPDRAVPMLPVELSTDICSLRPHVDRLVMSCLMEIDHGGEVVGYEISPGVIRSVERMTYTDVNAILEGEHSVRKRYERIVEIFELMRELALILNRKRQRRGSIDFDLPEPVIEFDEFGLMRAIVPSERNFAHRLIEEFMLSANECVASYLEHKQVASLYRIHEKPDPKKVYEFENTAAAFGYSLGVGALPVKRVQLKDDRRAHRGGRQASMLELPQEVHITPRMYQKLAQKIQGKPEERILSFLMLRSLKQARYSEENVGHFALAAATYTHFTSPIRRYPDLIVHRILKQVLAEDAEQQDGEVAVGLGTPAHSETPSPWGKHAKGVILSERSAAKRAKDLGAPIRARDSERSEAERNKARKPRNLIYESADQLGPIPAPVLHDIAEESSQAERRADDAERELMDWKKMKFMQERIGEEFDGLIISTTKFGFFVELSDLFIEGLVPLATLTDDRYQYHENTRQIIGQRTRKTYSLGDPVRVLVDRIDRMQRKIQFAVVEERPSRAQRKHRKK
jgi:ribonuclease R